MVYFNKMCIFQEEFEYLLSEDFECFYVYLEFMLSNVKFINENYLGIVMICLCRLFNCVRLEVQELNIFCGIFVVIDKFSGEK